MKKLLALTSAFAIVSTSSSSVISCNDVSNFEYYTDKIMNSIVDQKVTDDKNTQYSISDYFKTQEKTFQPDENLKDKPLTVNLFDKAIKQAVESIVPAEKNPNGDNVTAFTYELVSYKYDKDKASYTEDPNNKIEGNKLKEVKDPLETYLKSKDFNYFFIHITASDKSTKWKGSTSPFEDGKFNDQNVFKLIKPESEVDK